MWRGRPMDRLLQILLSQFVRRGNFRLTTARGTVLTFGDGTGDPVAIRFTTVATEIALLLDPELKFGECYMDGTCVVEQGSIAGVLALVLNQTPDGMPPKWARLQWVLRYIHRRWQQLNSPRRARRNVQHHYDLDG